MNKLNFQLATSILLSFFSIQTFAHTNSIGYVSDGGGDVTFWYGNWHAEGAWYNEGTLSLQGINGTSYNATLPFNILKVGLINEPSGLIPGTNYFSSNYFALVPYGGVNYAAFNINNVTFDQSYNWQGVRFTGLLAGTYSFTYNPVAGSASNPNCSLNPLGPTVCTYGTDSSGTMSLGPTQDWYPEDSIILSSTITLTDIFIALSQTIVQDTKSALNLQYYQLRSAYNSQVAASNLSLTHDCNLFDVKGLCISAGGRYTAIDNPSTNASAAVVTLGYKVNQNIRIGGFLDQNINIHTPGSINVANKNPLMGLYAVWNKEASGLGYQVRLANTYQDKDVTATRPAVDTSEAGSGTATLNSQSYLAELSYAFQYQDKALVRPYFGLRYTRLKQDGYTENNNIALPLTYDALADRSASALIGTKVDYQVTPKTTLTANLGIEQDLYHKVDNYTATNNDIGSLTPIAFNSNIKRTRPVASAGAYYDVTKAQRLSGTLSYQQLPFQATGAKSLYVNYMIGF